MHDPAFERYPPGERVATGDNFSLAQGRPILRLRCTERTRHIAIDLALAYCDRCGIGAAEPGGRFNHGVQHRLHIRGRAADDLQDVAGRGLVFERFFEVARAGLQFAEQPRVFDRDDRLVSERAHQFDLPLGVWLHSIPRETDRAKHGPLAQQRRSKAGTIPGRHSLGHRVVRVGEDVRNMHNLAFERHPPGDAVATGDNGSLAQGRPMLGVQRRVRHKAVDLALAYRDRCDVGPAKPGGGFGHCVQHRLHIGGRAADDVEHVAGRGLVFERFFEVARAGPQFTEQPRVLHRDDRLRRERFQKSNFTVGERPHLPPVGGDVA